MGVEILFILFTSTAPADIIVPGPWWGLSNYLWSELINAKVLNKMLAWQIQQCNKKYNMTQLDFSQEFKFSLN